MDENSRKLFDDIIAFATNRHAVKPSGLLIKVIDRPEVERLKKATGLVLKNYKFILDPDGMRHIYKRHALGATAGELPLSIADCI